MGFPSMGGIRTTLGDAARSPWSIPFTGGLTQGYYGITDAQDAARQAERDAAAQREELVALMNKPKSVMPTPDDQAVRAARRRSITQQLLRRGRASTIMSADVTSEPLGGA